MSDTTASLAAPNLDTTAPALGLEEGDLIDVGDAAKLLGIKERTVREWAKDEKLPCIYLGSLIKFHRRELVAWVMAQYRPARKAS